jgi:MOSC domain-containing protein YiiM
MRLVSVNVGTPREIAHGGRIVRTGIFKEPVQGNVLLGKLNLDGDRQADLSVHGGFSKAVYVYPAEHYDYWRSKLSGMELRWGAFGENFTVEGLDEKTTRIGDRFRIGTAEVIATEPRLPCYKLAVKFGREDIIKLFLRSRRTGFYCAVEQEGEVGAGTSIESLGRDDNAVTILELVEIYLRKTKDKQAMERVLQAKALPQSWRDYFQEQIRLITEKQ